MSIFPAPFTQTLNIWPWHKQTFKNMIMGSALCFSLALVQSENEVSSTSVFFSDKLCWLLKHGWTTVTGNLPLKNSSYLKIKVHSKSQVSSKFCFFFFFLKMQNIVFPHLTTKRLSGLPFKFDFQTNNTNLKGIKKKQILNISILCQLSFTWKRAQFTLNFA